MLRSDEDFAAALLEQEGVAVSALAARAISQAIEGLRTTRQSSSTVEPHEPGVPDRQIQRSFEAG